MEKPNSIERGSDEVAMFAEDAGHGNRMTVRSQMRHDVEKGHVDPALAERVKELFAKHDSDKNGTLDVSEVIAIAGEIEQDKKQIKMGKRILIGYTILVFLLIGALIGTSILAFYATQEQFVSNGRIVDSEGNAMKTKTLKIGCSFCAAARGESDKDFSDVTVMDAADESWNSYDVLNWSGSGTDFEYTVQGTRYNRATLTRYLDTGMADGVRWMEYTQDQPPLLNRVIWETNTDATGLMVSKPGMDVSQPAVPSLPIRKEQWLPLNGDWFDNKHDAQHSSRRRRLAGTECDSNCTPVCDSTKWCGDDDSDGCGGICEFDANADLGMSCRKHCATFSDCGTCYGAEFYGFAGGAAIDYCGWCQDPLGSACVDDPFLGPSEEGPPCKGPPEWFVTHVEIIQTHGGLTQCPAEGEDMQDGAPGSGAGNFLQ